MKTIIVVIFGFLIFISRAKSQPDIALDLKMNDEIPADIKSDIDTLYDKFFNSIESSDFDLFNEIFLSQANQKPVAKLRTLFYQLDLWFKEKVFTPEDEFYLADVMEEQKYVLVADKNTNYEYSLPIKIYVGNTYVSLLTSTDGMMMLKFIFYEIGGEWKLYNFSFASYSLNGKLPFDWYKSAKSKIEMGYYMDAYLEANMVKQILTPCNIRYFNHQKILDFCQKMDSVFKAEYVLPITVENIKTKPMIIGASRSKNDEEMFTAVRYVTKIPISDIVELKKENDLIHKEIGEIFPGLDKDKRYILYEVVDELMFGGEAEIKHEFRQELNG